MPGTISCDSCSDCTAKIAAADVGSIVYLSENITSAEEVCVRFTGISGVSFNCAKNSITGNRQETSIAVYAKDSPSVSANDCRISGYGTGIVFEDSNYSTAYLNSINNSGTGILINASVHANILANNVSGCLTEGLGGIVLVHSAQAALSGNNVSANELSGIVIQASSGNMISGNTADDNYDGITLVSSSVSNDLIRNDAGGNRQFGILIGNGSSDNRLNNNTLSENLYGLMLSEYAENNSVTWNRMCGSVYKDISQKGTGNNGSANDCDSPENWKDRGMISCTDTCDGICSLAGNYSPCGEVSLEEVINHINAWSAGEAELGEVVDLINAWSSV